MDESNYQLGAVTRQKGIPIAFYSQKVTVPQTRQTVKEKELLNIVETLKEFRTILLGKKLRVYTDQKILTGKNFNTDRAFWQRLILE